VDHKRRKSAVELLTQGTGLLSRSHLRELGLQRRAIDAVFRNLDLVILPGYSRPLIRVEDYLNLIDDCTFGDDVVHPIGDLARKHPRLRHPHGRSL
jgi:hypothetical protein